MLDLDHGLMEKPSEDPAIGRLSGADAWAEHEVRALREAILAKLTYAVGREPPMPATMTGSSRPRSPCATGSSTAGSTRTSAPAAEGSKRVYYLSLEFLIGRLLFDALGNLGLIETRPRRARRIRRRSRSAPRRRARCGARQRRPRPARRLLHGEHGEPRPPGLRLRHPLRARPVPPGIADGWQREWPEDWLAFGNPWEFERPDVVYPVRFGGTVERGRRGRHRPPVWRPARSSMAVAFDTPIVGWRGRHVNTLRLWSARAVDPFSWRPSTRGDYLGAMADRARAEAISRVLYPSDVTPAGQELRLRQEFFFTSASLQDLVRRHLAQQATRPRCPTTPRSSSTTPTRRSPSPS